MRSVAALGLPTAGKRLADPATTDDVVCFEQAGKYQQCYPRLTVLAMKLSNDASQNCAYTMWSSRNFFHSLYIFFEARLLSESFWYSFSAAFVRRLKSEASGLIPAYTRLFKLRVNH